MTGEAFVTRAPLRFAECDPAGIAFYPRLVERVNNTVEDWFAGPIGFSYAAMHAGAGVGVPTRSLEVSFERPGRLGDPIEHRLTVERLGRASIAAKVVMLLPSGATMLVARPTLVWCAIAEGRVAAAAIPEAVRARMLPFVEA